MRVREREHRKKREGHPANIAATTMDPYPVVILVVRLLRAAAMTNDRISFTKRTPAYDGLVAVLRPVGGNLVRRDGNWDEVDRTSQGFRPCLRPAKIPVGSGAPPPDEKLQLKENILLTYGWQGVIQDIGRLSYCCRHLRSDSVGHDHASSRCQGSNT